MRNGQPAAEHLQDGILDEIWQSARVVRCLRAEDVAQLPELSHDGNLNIEPVGTLTRMPLKDDYRRYAASIRELASKVAGEVERMALRDLAEKWDTLAECKLKRAKDD
jgi:hypothetical protein